MFNTSGGCHGLKSFPKNRKVLVTRFPLLRARSIVLLTITYNLSLDDFFNNRNHEDDNSSNSNNNVDDNDDSINNDHDKNINNDDDDSNNIDDDNDISDINNGNDKNKNKIDQDKGIEGLDYEWLRSDHKNRKNKSLNAFSAQTSHSPPLHSSSPSSPSSFSTTFLSSSHPSSSSSISSFSSSSSSSSSSTSSSTPPSFSFSGGIIVFSSKIDLKINGRLQLFILFSYRRLMINVFLLLFSFYLNFNLFLFHSLLLIIPFADPRSHILHPLGGDYDGDMYLVIGDERIVGPVCDKDGVDHSISDRIGSGNDDDDIDDDDGDNGDDNDDNDDNNDDDADVDDDDNNDDDGKDSNNDNKYINNNNNNSGNNNNINNNNNSEDSSVNSSTKINGKTSAVPLEFNFNFPSCGSASSSPEPIRRPSWTARTAALIAALTLDHCHSGVDESDGSNKIIVTSAVKNNEIEKNLNDFEKLASSVVNDIYNYDAHEVIDDIEDNHAQINTSNCDKSSNSTMPDFSSSSIPLSSPSFFPSSSLPSSSSSVSFPPSPTSSFPVIQSSSLPLLSKSVIVQPILTDFSHSTNLNHLPEWMPLRSQFLLSSPPSSILPREFSEVPQFDLFARIAYYINVC